MHSNQQITQMHALNLVRAQLETINTEAQLQFEEYRQEQLNQQLNQLQSISQKNAMNSEQLFNSIAGRHTGDSEVDRLIKLAAHQVFGPLNAANNDANINRSENSNYEVLEGEKDEDKDDDKEIDVESVMNDQSVVPIVQTEYAVKSAETNKNHNSNSEPVKDKETNGQDENKDNNNDGAVVGSAEVDTTHKQNDELLVKTQIEQKMILLHNLKNAAESLDLKRKMNGFAEAVDSQPVIKKAKEAWSAIEDILAKLDVEKLEATQKQIGEMDEALDRMAEDRKKWNDFMGEK